jgi:predicted aspartyl protease
MPAYDASRFVPPAPFALVVIRHPDHAGGVADVPMLIDSGADATLLPRSSVASIGIVGTGERYQLVAFDGKTSESEVVRADLVFLGRRFRGRYLLIDAEVGVVGRDVLNHLRLLLDGPAMNWQILPSSAKNA